MELDILRDKTHDLSQEDAWTRIFSLVQKPKTIFVTTPPCHTFSRARHRKPGPPPLRSKDWPKGFPWLSEKHYQEVEASNYFILQSVQASYLAHSVGNPYLWEHPEDLGKAADGLSPATIWQWPEILDLLLATEAQSFAFYQCRFHASYPKPTRILTTLPHFLAHKQAYSGLPSFTQAGAYAGPLPAQCSHGGNHEPLIGKDPSTGAWRTAPAASYPPAMCKWLAEALASSCHVLDPSLQAQGRNGSGPDVEAMQPTDYPFPPPLPSLGLGLVPSPGLDSAPSSGLDPAFEVPAAMPQSRHTPSRAPARSSTLSGLDTIAPRVPAVFRQPASHPSSGLGPDAHRVDLEHVSQTGQDTTTGEAGAHSSDAPEVLAEEILKRPSCTRAEVERLFDMLPKEVPPRREEGEAEGSSFSTGCYSKGGITGLRHNTTAFPLSTKLLVRFACQVFPSMHFTTLSLFDGVKTPMHRDSRNGPYPNGVCPISEFSEGHIWMEEEGGPLEMDTPKGRRPGRLLEVSNGPVVLEARERYHCTLPWQGRRLVLVAYVVAGLERLSADHGEVLSGLGFRLPDPGPSGGDETSEAHLAEPTEPAAVPFKPELCGNRGAPLSVEWEHKTTPITDGFGLCSPTRWAPCDRGHSLGQKAQALAARMHRLALDFVRRHVADPEQLCHALLLGKLEASPFNEELLQSIRLQWGGALGDQGGSDLLGKPDGQPFFLRALSRAAEILEDPDWKILTEGQDCFLSGVPVGFGETIGHVPQVFGLKEHWRKLDESEPDFDRANYKSADMSSTQLLAKFREEEKLGRMRPTTMGALREEYPADKIRVASMGAIEKPDGSVRPIHDGTHGVLVNNGIRLLNHVSVPGPAEMAFAVRQAGAQRETPLAVAADVSAAHRLVRIRACDHGLLACRSDNDSPTIWVNLVGTFGISSASFWWARLFGIVGRTVARCLLQHQFYQFAYVDDLHCDFYGRRKYLNFLIWLLLHEMIGTPFAYHKFRGGTVVAFIGYELDYGARLVGLSDSRGHWLIAWVDQAEQSRWVVQVRRFSEFLGRLGFVSRVIYWIKPHLAPLYAWGSVASKSHAAKLPDMVILTLIYLRETLGELDFKVSPYRVPPCAEPLFYTDAKCADNLVVLGGWDSRSQPDKAKWFSCRITPAEAPYLFDQQGRSHWASASAELLGTLAGLWAFGHLSPSDKPHQIPVVLPAVTDNRGNESLIKKGGTTKLPLMLFNMQLSHLLRISCLRLSLGWKPRSENDVADQLTNEVFKSVSMDNRVHFRMSDLPLDLFNKLLSTRSQFIAVREHHRTQEPASVPAKKTKTQW